ncbi:MAG: FAD-dependent oxidoreductase [Flexibacter sp. CG_4_10_14_3_um_filter_32_15]|nr:MAG: FAD-dependent oxidoreductase [Flexibacter sp. CG_4_10_14_3_um_filter_32_15]
MLVPATNSELNFTSELHIPAANKPRIVIIGGGFAGLELSKKLRSVDAQIVMIDRYNFHTFQPLLYQVATAGLEADAIAGPLRKVLKSGNSKSDFYFRVATVREIQYDKNTVATNLGMLRYDYLVIANGSKTNFYGNKSIEEQAFALKQVPQALAIRNHLLKNFEKAQLAETIEEQQSLMNVVIVGGGPTGVEVAGALGELKLHVLPKDYPELDFRRMQIHLVEAGNRLLNGMTDNAGKKAEEYLKDFTVQIWKEVSVKAFDGSHVELSNGMTLPSTTLVWAAGVTGNLIKGLPAEAILQGNRIIVDEYNRVKGIENIFALGDIAAMVSEEHPKGFPMLAPVAMQQGKTLGDNLKRMLNKKEMKPFKYFDKGSMATVGRNRAVVDLPNKMSFQGFFAWFVWLFVHLMFIIGFKNRFIILTSWVWNYFTYDHSNRLIIPTQIKSKKEKEELYV